MADEARRIERPARQPDTGEEDCSRELMQVRLDGKAVRGARDADGNQVRLLAALAGPDAATSVVAAQTEVGVKTDEVPMAAVVSADRPDGKIVTADALHTVKATANHIHEHGGEFVFPVKENRRAMLDALDALPWAQAPVARTATKRPWRDHHPHHPGLARPRRPAVPARQPGIPDRTVRQGTCMASQFFAVAALGVASPEPELGKRRRSGRICPVDWSIESLQLLRYTMYQEDRSTRQNPFRAPYPGPLSETSPSGHSAWPDAPRHRSHAMGRTFHGPPIHHPRTYITILERPGDLRRPGFRSANALASRSAGDMADTFAV